MDDSYLTIKRPSRSEIKVKGSRFIGETLVVSTVDDALARLADVRKREYQATHHCFAYIVGLPGNQSFKYSDDGEPNGTAGKPIYDVVAGQGVTNILCVITRYFGGTKLGTGGLVRAYGEAARQVMEMSGMTEHYVTCEFLFKLVFPIYDRWLKVVHELEATVVKSDFSDSVSMRIRIRTGRVDRLLDAFTEITSGSGTVEKISDNQTD
ncbi:MAG: hypothetical protein DRP45_05490 [Candidatus Zixiibacteriota bacterium]|nr:MAG: hypothetical protein DRP45_05490 [candidate division Zixibacteria bacterium]